MIFRNVYIVVVVGMLLSCAKSNGMLTPSIDSTSNAGVYILKKEYTNSNYIKRAAEMIPAIEMGADGVLYCAWYANKYSTDNGGEGSGAYITLSVSLDRGNTWSSNEIVIAPIDTLDRIFDESLWKDPLGNVHLFWSRSKKSWWDGKAAVWECTVKYNKTGYVTTSTPRIFINKGILLNKPIQIKNTSTILYPPYLYYREPSIQKGIAGAYVYSGSLDKFQKKLTFPDSISKIPLLPVTISTNFAETYFLQLSADTIASFIRTDVPGGVMISKSTLSSGLKNWTPFEKFKPIDTNPSVRFHVRRLVSGNILFITNNATDRSKMTAYLSVDNGRSFPYRLVLDARKNVSYPDATQESDGSIYVVFDRERTKAKDILFTKITENDIINAPNTIVTLQRINPY